MSRCAAASADGHVASITILRLRQRKIGAGHGLDERPASTLLASFHALRAFCLVLSAQTCLFQLFCHFIFPLTYSPLILLFLFRRSLFQPLSHSYYDAISLRSRGLAFHHAGLPRASFGSILECLHFLLACNTIEISAHIGSFLAHRPCFPITNDIMTS